MNDHFACSRGRIVSGNFVYSVEPDSPSRIVVAVPHDGLRSTEMDGLFQARSAGEKGRDLHTWCIARDIAAQAGAAVVRGLMPRDVLDYAQPASGTDAAIGATIVAFADPAISSSYFEYHRRIQALLHTSIRAHGHESVLLIELHGFVGQPVYAPPEGFDIILGTRNRSTIPFGEPDRMLAAFLDHCGYRVFLPDEVPVGPWQDKYDGSHTICHHARESGVCAIQIEVAGRFRSTTDAEVGRRIAADIARFLPMPA